MPVVLSTMTYTTAANALAAPRKKLSRACCACIKAKRRCSLDLPKCSRCLKGGMPCQYENQPLSEPKRAIEREHPPTTSQQANVLPSANSDSIPTLAMIRMSEPLRPVTVDNRTFAYLNDQLTSHIISFCRGGKTIFMHPACQRSSLVMEVQSLMAEAAPDQVAVEVTVQQRISQTHLYSLRRMLEALSFAVKTAYGFEDLLSIMQVLILLQILARFYLPFHLLPSTQQYAVDASLSLLKSMTYKLWQLAPTHLSSEFSAYEAYALSESIRRTIIMSREVQAHCSISSRGWFHPELFAACLPLDRRFALWDATPAEFAAACDSGSQISSAHHLITYRELVDMYDRNEITSIDGPFERMILVGARTVDAIESRYGI